MFGNIPRDFNIESLASQQQKAAMVIFWPERWARSGFLCK